MRYCRALLILSVLLVAYLAVVLTIIAPWPAAIVGAIFMAHRLKKVRELHAYGTARWATAEDLERAGMLNAESGLIVGRVWGRRPPFWESLKGLFDRRIPSAEACERFVMSMRKATPKPAPAMVKLTNAVHTAVFAPTGAGKGVSLIIPHLLTCPDSMVVVDFKGENARLTAEHRRREFGHRIVMLDPFNVVTSTPDTLNPLDRIDRDSPLALDDCRDLAGALVLRTGNEKEPHWNDSAEMWIGAMAAVTCLYAEGVNCSLQAVRTLLTDPAKMTATMNLMCGSGAWEGMLSRIGHQLTQFKDKELSSVLTTTNRHLRFLDTLAVAASTRSSSFDPADLRTGKMTVYLILPPEHMRAQSALLRMWIGATLRAVVRGGLQEETKVHFVLDEAASLGHMEALADAVDKYRGYGVRLIFMYQAMGQLKACWPEGQDQTLLSNTSQVFWAVNDQQTAEYVSNRLGEETIIVGSGGKSDGGSFQSSSPDTGTSRSRSWNANDNWAQSARKLLKPEEVAALPERTAITFTPGIPPLATTLVRYYEERLGNPPSRWRRLRVRVEVWAAAILLFGLLSVLGAQMTAILHHPSPYRAGH